MAFRYAFVAVLASTITVFALQNAEPTSIRFLVWRVDGIPVAGVILASVASGIVLVGVPLWIDRWRARSRARTLESRLAAAEALLAERERMVPPSPPPDSRGSTMS